jgi:hypothetical protein
MAPVADTTLYLRQGAPSTGDRTREGRLMRVMRHCGEQRWRCEAWSGAIGYSHHRGVEATQQGADGAGVAHGGSMEA